MSDTILTYLELFGIGFTFGISGPCLFVCAPILLTYVVGSKDRIARALGNIVIFSLGRLLAYLFEGYLAGLSGSFLKRILHGNIVYALRPLAGLVSILLGIFILMDNKDDIITCRFIFNKPAILGSIFILGFIIGIAPCPPLLVLLSQIALISKSGLEGMFYLLFFGLGTFFSGFIVMGILAGVFKGALQKFLSSIKGRLIFRMICALLLFLLGVNIITGSLLSNYRG